MKYAQIDFDTEQMQGIPRTLPSRWTSPEGATINGFDQLPRAALYGLGWVPVVYEDLPGTETHYAGKPVYSADDRQFVVEALPRDPEKLKAEACEAVDSAAGEASGRCLSTGIGQEYRYRVKAEEAAAYIAAVGSGETPDPAGYPLLAAEADAVGAEMLARAQVILNARAAWIEAAARIEAARMAGKAAVTAAETNEAAIAARNAAVAALEAI